VEVSVVRLRRSTGCVLDLRMQEKSGTIAHDRSRYKNHGTIIGGVTWAEHGMLFDGSTGYLDCVSDESLDITDAITIEFWVKRNELDRIQYIIGKYLTDNQRSYFLYFDQYDKLVFYISSDGGTINRAYFTTTNNFESTTDWYHIAAIFVPSSSMEIYVNGDNQAGTLTGVIQGSINSNDDPVTIGQIRSANEFNGSIDEVRVYNRALSADEIAAHIEAKRHIYGI
jgi:hypothetical protein